MKLRKFASAATLTLLFAVAGFAQLSPARAALITRPDTGDELIDLGYDHVKGRHQLVVENNSGRDAIVKVEDYYSKDTYRLVYVRAGEAYTIAEIRDGSFQLKFALGSSYSREAKMFQRDASFTKFETVRVFETQTFREGNWIRTRYSQLRVTLAPVPGGNASTKIIDKEDF